MKNEKMLSGKSGENGFIENIVYKNTTYVGEKGYTEVRFDFVNNTILEITSKFNSEAVVDYVFKNNLKDLEDISKEELVGNSKIQLDLVFDTFNEYDKNHVKEHIDWIHLFSGNICIRKANKEINLQYMSDLEDYLKALGPDSCHMVGFECLEHDENPMFISLGDYPNDAIFSLSEAIKAMIKVYKAVLLFNDKYGIEDYDIRLFIDAHEM